MGGRLAFVDDLRGLAVLCMILWHTADGWLAPGLEDGRGWEVTRLFGGMAAPLFLFLAGVGVALKAAADARRSRDPKASAWALGGRGLEIVAAGYGLRLFMWLVDAGAIAHLWNARAWLPMALGLVLVVIGSRGFGAPASRRRALLVASAGVGLFVVGVVQARTLAPTRVPGLLRVDVLQCIGASIIALAALSRPLALGRGSARLAMLGVAALLATSPMGELMPAGLPGPLAGYVARWATEPGVQPLAMFPLLPWLGYAALGAALAAPLDRAAQAGKLTEAVMLATVAGAALAMMTSEAVPYVFRLLSETPILTKLFRASYRMGLSLVFGGALFALFGHATRSPLRALGKTSLLVYCVHLELVFGTAGKPFKRALDYPEWLLATTTLTFAMYAVARVRLLMRKRNTKTP